MSAMVSFFLMILCLFPEQAVPEIASEAFDNVEAAAAGGDTAALTPDNPNFCGRADPARERIGRSNQL
jgi:hypothetical protein